MNHFTKLRGTPRPAGVPLFTLGQVVATPCVLELMDRLAINAADILARHQHGDWGSLSEEDARENRYALANDLRILSSYPFGDDRIWVITEADRSVTTLLLPEEY